MRPAPPRRRPARPVADAPVEPLLEGREELAKGWLVALVEQEPLDRAASIRTQELVCEGPSICTALLRALRSDAELEGLEERVQPVGELVGASTAEEVSRAVEALRAVVWSALLGSLSNPDGALVAELAERLAAVCEVARGAALRSLAGAGRWTDALESEVARARRGGTPLSLLLVELEDAAALLGMEPAGLDDAIRGVTGAAGAAVERDDGRAWVTARVDRSEAEELGSGLAAAVRGSGSPHGVALKANIGIATLGVDASDAAGLIEAAEEASLAAAARGIEVSRARTPNDAG